MINPIVHSIRNQPHLWDINGERARSKNTDYVFISFLSKGYRMERPVEKYLTFWERKALRKAMKYWKKKKIEKAAKQVNATQHQRNL